MTVSEKGCFIYETLKYLDDLKETIPATIEHFSALSKSALENNVLDKKTKTLIPLSLSILQNSQYCIKFHIESLMLQGLGYKELLEIISIVVYMGGGQR